MQFEVPQFIEVEDKIVGPLTWKQFIYVAGGAGVMITLWFILPFILFALIGLPFGALAGFLAFHKINNRPFSIFLESFFKFMSKSRLYLWRKDKEQTVISYSAPVDNPTSLPTQERGRLNSLAEKLEFSTLEQ